MDMAHNMNKTLVPTAEEIEQAAKTLALAQFNEDEVKVLLGKVRLEMRVFKLQFSAAEYIQQVLKGKKRNVTKRRHQKEARKTARAPTSSKSTGSKSSSKSTSSGES